MYKQKRADFESKRVANEPKNVMTPIVSIPATIAVDKVFSYHNNDILNISFKGSNVTRRFTLDDYITNFFRFDFTQSIFTPEAANVFEKFQDEINKRGIGTGRRIIPKVKKIKVLALEAKYVHYDEGDHQFDYLQAIHYDDNGNLVTADLTRLHQEVAKFDFSECHFHKGARELFDMILAR